MKPAPRLQVVHESETQRQHVRLPLPAKAEIGGGVYAVRDLSSGGIAVKGIDGRFARGQRFSLRLTLPFGSFFLDADFEAVAQYYDAKEKILGCLFVSLTAEQVSLLNHMLKAWLAGDVVTSDGLLNITSRNNFTKPRKPLAANANVTSFWGQIPGLLAILGIGAVIVLFVLGNLYDTLFVLKAADAAVAAPTVLLRAPADGIYQAKIDPDASLVGEGQVIGMVGGTEIKSPCRCVVVSREGAEGVFIAAGGPVATLVPVDAQPWVTAEIEPALAAKIGPDTRAEITVFGVAAPYTGHVVGMESGLAQPSGGRPVVMKILTDRKLPAGLVNRPAAVSFRLH